MLKAHCLLARLFLGHVIYAEELIVAKYHSVHWATTKCMHVLDELKTRGYFDRPNRLLSSEPMRRGLGAAGTSRVLPAMLASEVVRALPAFSRNIAAISEVSLAL